MQRFAEDTFRGLLEYSVNWKNVPALRSNRVDREWRLRVENGEAVETDGLGRTDRAQPTTEETLFLAGDSERCTLGHGDCNVTAAPRDPHVQLDRPRIGGHVALGVAQPPPRAPARFPLVHRPSTTGAFAYAIDC